MSKENYSSNIFGVLANGIKIYLSNIDRFLLYMLFPVFGQVLGIALALVFPLLFSNKIIAKTNSVSSALLYVLLLAIPGILIFMKAFWDYMIAYVALNSMTEAAVLTGKVYDFPSHNEVATRRIFKYIGFLMFLGILLFIGMTPFCIVPACVVWVYFVLIFQVFTFEPEISIKQCYKRSFQLIRGNWLQTAILLVFLIFFSIYIISQGITVVFDYLNVSSFFRSRFDFIGEALPLETINEYLNQLKLKSISVEMISDILYMTVITSIISGITLPIRSICWSLWYKGLSDKKTINEPAKKIKKRKQKASKEE